MSAERWRSVVGFAGLYEVSSKGRVRSLARLVRYSNGRRPYRIAARIRKTPLVRGYPSLFLSKRGTKTFFYVHHLVATAFLGPRLRGLEVAHYDGDASNCVLSNLRYATAKENAADSLRHGTRPRGERNGHAKLSRAIVLSLRRSRRTKTFAALGDQYRVSESAIRKVINGQRWTHL